MTYVKIALLGRKLGKEVIMVVEKIEEIRQIVQLSKEMNVSPILGLRVRLQSKSSGRLGDQVAEKKRKVWAFHRRSRCRPANI